MKQLIIAEKPSVATDLSKCLGKFKKVDDHYENDTCIISSAVGHLVELVMPQEIDEKYKSWNVKYLPIIPETFQLRPIERTKKKFTYLKKLMSRKDVGTLVNACDAGREGELIFSYIYELAKSKKPVKRMWMSSMTPASIREAFEKMREGEQMVPLQDAARCRSESDWLIGINGTRVITSRLFGFRGGQAASVGRVQTPTLTMVVEREKTIRNFEPRAYWKIVGSFGVHNGLYEGTYQKPNFKKGDDEHDRSDRLWSKEDAEAILAAVKTQDKADVTEETKRSKQGPPLLYDLTSLQREANSRFSFSAARTLQIAQALYEKYKVITYPRTDARALPEDYGTVCQDTLRALKGEYAKHAAKVIEGGWVNTQNKRVFNNKKISDHFAIIPTNQVSDKLTHDEERIYELIVRRFISVFYPHAEYDVSTRISQVAEHAFKTEGRVLAVPGWLEVYGRDAGSQSSTELPALCDKDGNPAQASIESMDAQEDATKPPPRFSEATLLGAMESAGKFVEEEELAEALKDKGIGTPATRAQIIDNLIRDKYIDRVHKELIPTTKAEHLIEFLDAADVGDLTSPAMTGEWEHKLHEIEKGNMSRQDFMEGIGKMTSDIVERTKAFDENNTNTRPTNIKSPIDGELLIETIRAYRSPSGDFSINKVLGNRRMEETEIQQLIDDRVLGPLDNFRSKSGKAFSAMLKLGEDNKVKFVFNNEGEGEGAEGEIQDLSQFEKLGSCPKAKLGKCAHKDANVLEMPTAYACEYQAKKDGSCDFRVSRNLLGRLIERDQFEKLLTNGKTDLLDKFKSKRTGRFFSAHLILKEDGQIGFEFAPRASGAAKKTAAKKTATKKAATKKTVTKKATTKKTTAKKS